MSKKKSVYLDGMKIFPFIFQIKLTENLLGVALIFPLE